jgi:hypothetical protein
MAKVVSTDLHSIFGGFLKLAFLAGAALYAGLVLRSYRAEGSHLRPQVDLRNPAHSAERLAVWLGVMALALAKRVTTKVFGMLSEASAEVGEWFLGPRHHESR